MKQLYNEYNIFEFIVGDKKLYKFKENLIKDVPGIFSYCNNCIELKTDLEYSGVFDPICNKWDHEHDYMIVFESEELAIEFIDRLNKYIKRLFDLL